MRKKETSEHSVNVLIVIPRQILIRVPIRQLRLRFCRISSIRVTVPHRIWGWACGIRTMPSHIQQIISAISPLAHRRYLSSLLANPDRWSTEILIYNVYFFIQVVGYKHTYTRTGSECGGKWVGLSSSHVEVQLRTNTTIFISPRPTLAEGFHTVFYSIDPHDFQVTDSWSVYSSRSFKRPSYPIILVNLYLPRWHKSLQ